jgi:fructose-1,6-bisphosphatase/inositol monophosphatase family enzyme
LYIFVSTDGTTNFVHRLSLTCVLISFLLNKQPKVGVIYDPMADEMFWAIHGKGAFMTRRTGEIRALQTSGTKSLPQAIVSMDAGYSRDEKGVQRYLSAQRAILLKRVQHIRVLGCCGLTMAYVACGRLDAGFEEGSWEHNSGPKIWDFSPGKLIVEEAGGVTRDLTGRHSQDKELDLLQRSVFMAATPELAKELMDAIYGTP